MIGWEKRTIEPGAGLPLNGLTVPPSDKITGGWVTLAIWTKEDAQAFKLFGPSKLYGHIGYDQGDPGLPGPVADSFPKGIVQQWLRASAEGLTQRHPHAIVAVRNGADGFEGPEFLRLDDFPLKFQVWQTGGVLTVRKVSTCIDSPDSRMADRLIPPGAPD